MSSRYAVRVVRGGNGSFLIDESLTKKLAKALSEAGYPVATVVGDPNLVSTPDPVIFRHARALHQTIITRDTDFLKANEFPPPHAGIIVVRLPGITTSTADIKQAVLNALTELAGQDLSNKVYEIRPDGVHLA